MRGALLLVCWMSVAWIGNAQPVNFLPNADPQHPTNFGWLTDTLCFPASLLEEGAFYCSYATYTNDFPRCDDDIGYMTQGLKPMETRTAWLYGGNIKTVETLYGPCFVMEKGSLVETSYKQTTYNYAWVRKAACDPNVCEVGHKFSGCMRHNPGKCTPCTIQLYKGYHFSTRGTCDQAECGIASPGFYIATGCARDANTGFRPCVEHPDNVRKGLNGAKYYCPGGVVDLVAVPSNAHVTDDSYVGFTCNEGYFKNEERNGCTLCTKGNYCRGGVKTQCKKHYYSDGVGSTQCKRCTRPSDCTALECEDTVSAVAVKTDCGMAPEICVAGSQKNSNCVMCGMCGLWPKTGLSCVTGYEMDGLPAFDPM